MPLFSSSSKNPKKSANEFKAISYDSTSKYHNFDNSHSTKPKDDKKKKDVNVNEKEKGEECKKTPYEQWVAETRRKMEK
ncbi:hypothetical protein PMZ80_009740 [Knufia obscura]|uniref:Uncharacterized protein n=2 Tax=Knufia TaxID=430999 RepID=A0AAN8EHG2_9EURO|nr:hypothetical protein PMZ80_009740 [Knufia obscura]KAK5949695.1 hypothetical protein OHC33_009292 [Knufia fluminis]